MKWKYILLLSMLMCSIGLASAKDNSSTVVIDGIVDMSEVSAHGASFWKSANANGGAGYLLLGIGLVSWILVIMFAAFSGSASYAIGDAKKDADQVRTGIDRLKRVVVAIIAPPVLLILLGIFVGLI